MLTNHPYHAMALSTALAVADTWTGLTLAYYAPQLPPSFTITTTATTIYTTTLIVHRVRRRRANGLAPARSAVPHREHVTTQL